MTYRNVSIGLKVYFIASGGAKLVLRKYFSFIAIIETCWDMVAFVSLNNNSLNNKNKIKNDIFNE